MVSPLWIYECWKQGKLVPTSSFGPRVRLEPAKQEEKKQKTRVGCTNLFRGIIFCCWPSPKREDSSSYLEYSQVNLEQDIRDMGGQILTAPFVQAVLAGGSKKKKEKIKCIVLRWGSEAKIHEPSRHTLLGRLGTNVDLQWTTPVWLHSCGNVRQVLSTKAWYFAGKPWRKLEARVCVSGFSGAERLALGYIVPNIEHDLNKHTTTHLVCQNSDSRKYRKAREWKIPTVSREWLQAALEEGDGTNTEKYAI